MKETRRQNIGIDSIGIKLPPLAMSVQKLAKLRHIDPEKFTIGLGCCDMALCPQNYGVADLATAAAKRALDRWRGDVADIGMIAVGTETPTDHSRPLSAWVAEGLGICGYVRSYEVKHACYGGTLALKQAVEWLASGAGGDKAALVIAADIALYAEEDPGEATQGAGAVAMIISKDASIAIVEPISYCWSKPVFDFWKPLDEAYPRVDGKFSLECYKEAAAYCVKALVEKEGREKLKEFDAMCFHVPFPKMVYKAFSHIGHELGISESKTNKIFMEKVEPYLAWNRLSGNAYTASLWINVANALQSLKPGQKLTAFSYGSGCGAELLLLTAGSAHHASHVLEEHQWTEDFEQDTKSRKQMNINEYQELRHTQ